MYFVVFWGEWCATIPASWLTLKSQVFRWPPKNKNPTVESKKGAKPQENWITITYTKLLGPFDTFQDAREVENNTLDISTNDEEKLTDITNKRTTEVPQKRTIKKPCRFRNSFSSSGSSETEEDLSKTKIIDKENNLCSIKKIINNPINETVENSNIYKPPTNYKSIKKHVDFCYVPNECQESLNENDCAMNQKYEIDSDPLFYGDFSQFTQKDIFLEEPTENIPIHEDPLCTESITKSKASSKPIIKSIVATNIPLPAGILHSKKNKSQSWNSENNSQKLLQLNDRNTDTDNKKQKADSHHEKQTSQNIDEKKEVDSHHECCRVCRNDNKTILRTVIAIRQILLDSNPCQLQEETIDLDLPIYNVEKLQKFNKTLCENAAARLQYQKMIRTIGGITPYKHARNAMRLTIADALAYKMTWTSKKNKIETQNMTFINLIIETLITTRNISVADVQKVLKSWLQHAGDRISKNEREEIQNGLLDG